MKRLRFILGQGRDEWLENPMALHVLAMWLPCSSFDRAAMYKKLGVNIGEGARVDYGVWIDPYAGDRVYIDDWASVGYGATILSHFARLSVLLGVDCFTPATRVGRGAFIGPRAIVLPGVTVGDWSIVGPGAVVSRDVPPESVAVGVPARTISGLEDYIRRYLDDCGARPELYRQFTQGFVRVPASQLPGWMRPYLAEPERDRDA
jgi:serine acetyltransferase